VATERELKYSTVDDHVPGTLELQLALTGTGLSVLPGTVQRHVDVYHDADERLASAGMALRIRRSTTGVKVTLKSDARVTSSDSGVLHERSELEVPVGDPVDATSAGDEQRGAGTGTASPWPESVRSSLPPGVAVERLAPVAELRVRRVAYLVVHGQDPNGAAPRLAELAFDEVTCVPPGSAEDAPAAAVFHEVEIEWLGEGDELDQAAMDALGTLAEAVGSVVDLTASPASKLDRALALLSALDPD
jgi:inorganic triphosphatase YgiF